MMFTSYQNQAGLFNRLKNEMIGLYAKVNRLFIPADELEILFCFFKDQYSRTNDYHIESRTISLGERKCIIK